MKSSEKAERVSQKLDAIEAEMKRIGFWSADPPDFEVRDFSEAPSFELWLQCIFLPNARRAALEKKFPRRSEVGLMAMRQYDYHSFVEEAQNLKRLLEEFDAIVEAR
jgi:uncharacterized protein YqcC (DUF446 family)